MVQRRQKEQNQELKQKSENLQEITNYKNENPGQAEVDNCTGSRKSLGNTLDNMESKKKIKNLK